MHETSEQRGTFDFHGTEGWYVGPASDHYRCHCCYLPQSNRERIAITVSWLPQNIPIPQVSTKDYLRQKASDMLHILKTKDDTNSSTLTFGAPIFNAFRHIAQILKRATDPPPAPIIEPSSPASALRVETSTTQQSSQPAAPSPRVETLQPPVITNSRREVLRKLVQKLLRRSKCQRLPTERYGPRSVFQTAQSVIDSSVSDNDIERLFSHHIAAHIHCPVTAAT